ncbi:MAG: proteinase inhibitor [Myxococcota bacterium]
MRTVFTVLAVAAACTESPPAQTADPVEGARGRCTYLNGFSEREECKEYVGAEWTDATMRTDCAAPLPATAAGAFVADEGCDTSAILGTCRVGSGTPRATNTYFLDGPGYTCDGLATGCGFSGGTYEPAPACEGAPTEPPADREVFAPYRQVCVDPLPGEPPGQGPDGQVCTWEAISGSTEEGRRYQDYASCDPVFTQRPAFAVDRATNTPPDDPRLTDPEWQAEFAWVNAQVEANACACCHTAELSRFGPALWWLEQEGLWVDALSPGGLGMMAGWVDSTAFGTFDAVDNNGFDRSVAGLPTTNPERMVAFFEGELARRGITRADLEDTPPFGGPLYDQIVYEPSMCPPEVSIGADGSLNWIGGVARYVYVMSLDSASPGVPPDLDLPAGVMWRLDVAPESAPVASGLRYGELPPGTSQGFPADGSPEPLVSGQTVYLYVTADVTLPITRCLAVVP